MVNSPKHDAVRRSNKRKINKNCCVDVFIVALIITLCLRFPTRFVRLETLLCRGQRRKAQYNACVTVSDIYTNTSLDTLRDLRFTAYRPSIAGVACAVWRSCGQWSRFWSRLPPLVCQKGSVVTAITDDWTGSSSVMPVRRETMPNLISDAPVYLRSA
jgi:hypothetical protein